MGFEQQLADPRLATLDPVRLATVRERMWVNYLSEDPKRVETVKALSPEGQQKARERFNDGLATFRPDLFKVKLREGKGQPSTPTGDPLYPQAPNPDYEPTVYRPLYDSRTEGFLEGIRTGKIDTAKFDDAFFEEVTPFVKANTNETDFDNFISPYRERLLKDGVSAATYTGNALIRGMAPSVVEQLAVKGGAAIESKIGDLEEFQKNEEKFRKWKVAYGGIDANLRTAGAITGLVAGGAGLSMAISKAVSRAGPSVAAQVLGAGAIEYSYADKLPGFSAELVDDPGLKKTLTALEGAAFAGAGALLAGAGRARPRPVEAPVPPSLSKIDPQRAIEALPPTRETPKPSAAKPAGAVKEFFGDILTPISTRLDNIAPRLKTRLRQFEFDLHTTAADFHAQVRPWLKDKKVMSKVDDAALDFAEKNRDAETVNRLVGKYSLTEQYAAKQQSLARLREMGQQAGFDVGYLDNFAPRKVKDYEKFAFEVIGEKGDWGEWGRLRKAEEQRLGVDVLDPEAQARLADQWIRGFGGDRIQGAKPGPFKQRKIQTVTEKLNKYYKHSDEALLDYIDTVVNSTAKKRFLGSHLKATATLEGQAADTALRDSIGSWVSELSTTGQIAPWHEAEVAKIFQARLLQRPQNKFVKAWKNVNYIDTMGSPTSAVTQLGDMAWSAYRNGYYETAKAALGTRQLRMADVGIDKVAAEFGTRGATAKAVDRVFDAVGLTQVDRWGKETLMNASLAEWRKIIRAPTGPKNSRAYRSWKKKYDKFGGELVDMFGAEAPKVIDDLANGRMSENVKFLAFNRLADFQPIALSEVPVSYLKHPNGRIFYQLKTFTLKQLDVFRREAFREIKRGNVAGGLKNLVRLGMAFFFANATADMIKDVMMNRESNVPDVVVDNLLRMIGMNRYAAYDMRRNKDPAKTLMMQALPPTRFIRATSKDVMDALDGRFEAANAETLQTIPIAGKPYYWWFGGGAEKMADKDQQLVETR